MKSPTVDTVMVQRRVAALGKRSIKTASKEHGLRLALSMLDLTTLEGKDTPERIRTLCRKAEMPDPEDATLPSAAAVCVYPAAIATCVESLRPSAAGERDKWQRAKVHIAKVQTEGGPSGSVRTARPSVKIAAVATGFPSGQYPLTTRLEEVRRSIADGADEIDMVINRAAFLAGRYDQVTEEIRLTKAACVRSDGSAAAMKVILETGELETLDNVRRASDLAIGALTLGRGLSGPENGAQTPGRGLSGPASTDRNHGHDSAGTEKPPPHDFIKTSTGKVQPAATMAVTLVMLEAMRDCHDRTGIKIGMKPAGGIRTAKQALQYLVLVNETLGPEWLTSDLFRFGASTLCNDIVRQLRWLKTGKYAAAYDVTEG